MAAIPIIDEPLLDRVHRLASPAFAVSPPVRHAQTKRKIRAPHILEPLWNARTVSVHAVDFYCLRNVLVTATGLVFDEQGRLFRSSIGYSTAGDVNAAHWAINRIRRLGGPSGAGGPAVLCTQPAMHPDFHWLTVGLPRAMLARAELNVRDLRYAIADRPDPLRAAMHESLGLAGITKAEIIELNGTPQFFTELFVIDGLATPELYLSPLVTQCLETLIAPIPAAPRTRLYVMPSPTGPYRLAQADVLAGIAEQEGYTAIDPTALRLTQQISLFKGASHAVGLGGAQLANALFMAEESHIGALMPAGAIDNGGWLISQLKRHNYAELLDRNPPPATESSQPTPQEPREVAIGKTEFRRFLRGL